MGNSKTLIFLENENLGYGGLPARLRLRLRLRKQKPWCGVAVLLCCGRKEAGRKGRKNAAGGRYGKGRVFFGFILLDDPCPSDYAQGKRGS
jgi:hypothetical protein